MMNAITRVTKDVWTPAAKAPEPDLGDALIPASRYTSREFMKLEWERMWTKVWLMGCREEEIPDVGPAHRQHEFRGVVAMAFVALGERQQEAGQPAAGIAIADRQEVITGRIQLLCDGLIEFKSEACILHGELMQDADRQATHARWLGGLGIESMHTNRSEADVVAGKGDVDDLPFGVGQYLVDQDRAGFDLVDVGLEIAFEKEVFFRGQLLDGAGGKTIIKLAHAGRKHCGSIGL